MKTLACGNDGIILRWTYDHFDIKPTKVPTQIDLAVGVLDGPDLVGAALFQSYSGSSVELSYYGPNTMTRAVWRDLMRIAIDHFGVSRVTVKTMLDNKTAQKVEKLGFVKEGICHHYYGKEVDAMMFGIFGKNLVRLAGRTMQ